MGNDFWGGRYFANRYFGPSWWGGYNPAAPVVSTGPTQFRSTSQPVGPDPDKTTSEPV